MRLVWTSGRALTWCLLAGGLAAIAFSPWAADLSRGAPAALMALSVAGLIVGLRGMAQVRLAALGGLLYGTVWLIGGTGWMYVSLHRFGGLPAWLAVLAVLVLCSALSLFMAGVAAAWVHWRRGAWAPDGLLFGCLWVLAEWARGTVLTGFPWASSGYALVDSPLVALAPWLGVYGMGGVFVALVACWVLAAPAPRAMALAGAPLLMSVLFLSWADARGLGQFTSPLGRPLTVTLLQGNIPQNEKFESAHLLEQLRWHAEALAAARADLVIAPETAIPLLPSQLPEGYWEGIRDAFSQPDRAALIGIPLGDSESGYTNSVVGLSGLTGAMPGGIYRYNKHHLVPFGEFIPYGFHWFVTMMNIPLGDFTRGPRNAPSFEVAGQRVAPTICYEDLFGEELADRFVSTHGQAPTLFANVSNLAWFGESVAIHQHLQVARLRSLEFQRPTIRATNTGATVVIDHRGQIVAMQPTNTRGALFASVQGRQGNTPYANWVGRTGLWPLVLLAMAGVWLLRRSADSGR